MPLADCERLTDGLLMQPGNAVSSLAFVLAGILVPVVVRRRGGGHALLAWTFGLVLFLVGVGSVAFHGPGGPAGGWVHDASITALLLLVLAVEVGHRADWSNRQVMMSWVVAASLLMLAEGVWPRVGDPLNVPLAAFAVLSVLGPELGFYRYRLPAQAQGRRSGLLVAITLLATGAIVMLLSRTGAPLCFPDTMVQGHAVWHLLAAAGLGIYAVSVTTGADQPAAVPL